MKHRSKLSEEQQQTGYRETGQQAQAGREFADADELLRYDAAHTPVPPDIARRLRESTTGLTAPKPSWWKRWLKGNPS